MFIENRRLRWSLLAVATVAVAGTLFVLETTGPKSSVPPPPANLPVNETSFASAPDFAGATGWLDTPGNASLNLVGLRGQVVLVDFWTYSCINCLHTLPHITKLYDTYHDHGFLVVGVHSPEFGFEKVRSNVASAIQRYGIHYPVAQDNAFGIWNAYGNQYWPSHFLIDQYGKVRESDIGEGGYAKTENEVRALLAEANRTGLPPPFESVVEDHGDHSPELYAAETGRSALGNAEGYHAGSNVTYGTPSTVAADQIYVTGPWHDGDESLTALGNGTVEVNFRGAAANLVAGGPAGCLPVMLDGKPIAASQSAVDVAGGCLHVNGTRSYDIYAGARETHTLLIHVPAGFEIFTFDFT
ncbi:MAG: redoxin family protein [Thermoplasmatota archaeon]